MAPVIKAIAAHPALQSQVVVTGQHRQMLDQALDLFGIVPDMDLDVMQVAQSLPDLTARILQKMAPALERMQPDAVLVHGDTTSTLAASLSAFYARIPAFHVEAGLRTGDLMAPWPEEMNRRLTAPLCQLHFAPTERSRRNLVSEGIPESTIHVTGNTVIDALLHVNAQFDDNVDLHESIAARFPFLDPKKRLLLVTGHRRENFGTGFRQICQALSRLGERDDIQIVYPVHMNPNVEEAVRSCLSGRQNIFPIEPQDYVPFVYLMRRSHAILTDSGGIQEEGPSLGKPVLVMRDTTERPEAVEAGTVKLVGTDESMIVREVNVLFDDPAVYSRMEFATNPYGDGAASSRIVHAIDRHFYSANP